MAVPFDYQPRLRGPLLELRPAEAGDWAGLRAVGADPEVWAGHPDRNRYLEPNFHAFFEEGLASGGALVAVRRDTGEIVGWSRYSAQYAGPGEMEIGWTFLGKAYWGGPYNAEMKRLMLDHAFRFVDRVIFRIGESNGRSRRAVEKLGARLTDVTQVRMVDGKEARYLFYALSRSPTTPTGEGRG